MRITKFTTEDPLVFDRCWWDIPEQDWPEDGMIFVVRTGQEAERPLHQGWTVAQMGDGTLENDNERLGLFWQKEHAVTFANAIVEQARKE